MTVLFIVTGLCVVGLAVAACAGEEVFSKEWESVGPGGGGTGIMPSISPHNSKLYFCACDMQGFYRSDDAGKSWRVYDGMKIRAAQTPVVFHPTNPKVMYVGILGGLMKSTDGGYKWTKVFGRVGRVATDIARSTLVDPRDSDTVYAFFDHFDQRPHSFLVKSTDAGKTWEVVWKQAGVLVVNKLFMNPANGTLYGTAFCYDYSWTGFDTGVPPKLIRSTDDGRTWAEVNKPEGRIVDGAMVMRNGKPRLYALLKTEIRGEKVVGGFFRSDDEGKTWEGLNSAFDLTVGYNNRRKAAAPKMEFKSFAVSDSDGEVIYIPLVRHGKEPEWMSMVYKSTDGGDTWARVMNSDSDWGPVNIRPAWLGEAVGWWWGGLPNSCAMAPNDPDTMLFCDDGQIIGTTDGGKVWKPLYTKYYKGGRGESNGWEVTNCYTYEADPFDYRNRFITYTDMGLFKSRDGGKTWKWSVGLAPEKAPWRGNFYHIVFDGEVKGRIWGAVTPVHDLPHWKMLQLADPATFTGTVVVSHDCGESWSTCVEEGLADTACTHLLLDPKSPKSSRTLYAAMFGKGVFKSTNGGRTWAAKNEGLGFPGNLNVWQVKFLADGALLASVSAGGAGRDPIPGGLFRSRDGGESWEFVNESRPLPYPFGIATHPTDPNTFYCGACDLPVWYGQGLRNRTDDHMPMQPVIDDNQGALGGGLYKTTDGGKTFRRTLGVWNCYSPSIDPRNPKIVYAACFDTGAFRSTDGGERWKRLEGLPAVNVNQICFDPRDAKRIYALTCGIGVWTRRIG